MPVVPTRSPVPSVATAPLPGVRLNPNAPDAAFRRPAPVDFSGVTDAVAKLYQRHRQHADQVAVLDADTQLTQFRSQLLSDPRDGILAARGKNALDASDGWATKWRDGVGAIRASLTNDEQRLTFDRMAQGQFARAHEEVETHVSAQLHHYEQETVNASLDGIYDDIIQHADNPDLVAAGIEKGRAVATDWANRQGFSPEQRQQSVAKLVSQAHVGVMLSLVNKEQDLAAADYFAKHQSELTGPDLTSVEKVVQAGSLRAASQQHADAIMAAATSVTDGLTKAREISEPKLRDEVEDRVRRGFQDREAAKRADEEDRYQSLSDSLRTNGGDFYSLPKKDVLALSPSHYDHLKQQADEIRYPKVHTNNAEYANLVNMASLSESTRAEFAKLDLTQAKYRQILSESDYQAIVGLQRIVRDQTHRTSESADHSVRRKEESTVVKQLDKSAFIRNMPDTLKKSLGAFLPKASVTIPQWMMDSAKVDPDYADYLRLHGFDIDTTSAGPTPNTTVPAVPGQPKKAAVPGGPLLNLTPAP